MKNIKRMMSCFLVFLHLVLCAIPVCASTGVPEIEMEDNAELKSPDVIAVETAVEQYFEQREYILSETEGDISQVDDWNVADEEKHLAAMKSRGVVRKSAILTIDTVSVNEKYATVLATRL